MGDKDELEYIRKKFPPYVHGMGGVEHAGGRGHRPRTLFSYTLSGSNVGYGYADALAKARANVAHWGYDPATGERVFTPKWVKVYEVIMEVHRAGMRLHPCEKEDLRTFYETRGQIAYGEVGELMTRAEAYPIPRQN